MSLSPQHHYSAFVQVACAASDFTIEIKPLAIAHLSRCAKTGCTSCSCFVWEDIPGRPTNTFILITRNAYFLAIRSTRYGPSEAQHLGDLGTTRCKMNLLFWSMLTSRSRRELPNGVPNAFGFDRGACLMMLIYIYLIASNLLNRNVLRNHRILIAFAWSFCSTKTTCCVHSRNSRIEEQRVKNAALSCPYNYQRIGLPVEGRQGPV